MYAGVAFKFNLARKFDLKKYIFQFLLKRKNGEKKIHIHFNYACAINFKLPFFISIE